MIRLLVIDDSVTIRAMIETLFERDRDITIVGVAADAEEAYDLIDEHDPHVITLDIAMPGKDGLTILDEIMKDQPRPVIMLSSLAREGSLVVDDAMARGALACFNKTQVVREIDKLIKLVKELAPERQTMKEAFLYARYRGQEIGLR
jgi:chemotaxis response regulator CheB